VSGVSSLCFVDGRAGKKVVDDDEGEGYPTPDVLAHPVKNSDGSLLHVNALADLPREITQSFGLGFHF
jgi:hypothetical protein